MVLPQAGLEPAAELRSCGSDDFGYQLLAPAADAAAVAVAGGGGVVA
jgi:hypothetical protein